MKNSMTAQDNVDIGFVTPPDHTSTECSTTTNVSYSIATTNNASRLAVLDGEVVYEEIAEDVKKGVERKQKEEDY